MFVLEQKRVTCNTCDGKGEYQEVADDGYAGTEYYVPCTDCDGEGTRMEYLTWDLWQACHHHGLDVTHVNHGQILRMRCIIALRDAKILD